MPYRRAEQEILASLCSGNELLSSLKTKNDSTELFSRYFILKYDRFLTNEAIWYKNYLFYFIHF